MARIVELLNTRLRKSPSPGGEFRHNGVHPRELPLRAELFGTAQLESHAALLAQNHKLIDHPGPELLLRRLDANALRIRDAYGTVAAAAAQGRSVQPAAEWLLDNYYLIEEQIEAARDHLPHDYSYELPRLGIGPNRGMPRVYDLALELVSHTDGQVDAENLSVFIASYQSVTPLRIGELWAIPIMLRLALIENLRRVSQRISAGRVDRDTAMEWSARFLKVVQQHPKYLITELADFVRANPPLSKSLISELATHLQGQHAALALVLNWLEHQLSEQGQTMEQIQLAESQEQAADHISIGNSITSLRNLATYEWKTFVERQSLMELVLSGDPAHVYAAMDFATRDRYRHRVEHLARYSGLPEEAVAQEAVTLAKESAKLDKSDDKPTHIGYYLIDRGLLLLEQRIGYHPPLIARLRRARRAASHCLPF